LWILVFFVRVFLFVCCGGLVFVGGYV